MGQLNKTPLLIFLTIIALGCNRVSKDITPEILNDQGMVEVEMYLKGKDQTGFLQLRELAGRSTILVREGQVGGEIRSYELYEKDHAILLSKVAELYTAKKKEGFRIFGPESFHHLIIRTDLTWWGESVDPERLVFVEELIHECLVSSGNGRFTGSDADAHVSFFAVVFDKDAAIRSILKAFQEHDINLPVVIAIEKGSDIQVIHPENYQGDFSLI